MHPIILLDVDSFFQCGRLRKSVFILSDLPWIIYNTDIFTTMSNPSLLSEVTLGTTATLAQH